MKIFIVEVLIGPSNLGELEGPCPGPSTRALSCRLVKNFCNGPRPALPYTYKYGPGSVLHL